MANATYNKLLGTLTGYLDEDKAKLAIERQLERVEATEDTVTNAQIPKMLNFMMGAITLYLPDKAKQQELKSQLQALA